VYLILTQGRVFELPGGEANATMSLAKWLCKKNHDVTVMGSSFANIQTKRLSKIDIEKERIIVKKKIKVWNPPYIIYMFSRLFLSILWMVKIILINSKSPIKLIHAQDTGYSGLAAIFAGKILQIPVILTSHGIRHKSLEHSLQGKLIKPIIKFEYKLDIFTINNADCVIGVNPIIKNYYDGLAKKNIEFIPITIKQKNFGFSENNRQLIRKEFEINKNTNLVGYIGRLSPEKNIQTLILSFVNQDEKNSLKLLLVGTGTEELKLKKLVNENNLQDKVIFCGFRNDVSIILSAIDIFVLPSFTEGLPTAMIEAMATQRAIICSNIPALKYLVQHEKEALLIDPNNPEELKQAIKLLCNNLQLREKLQNNAKIKSQLYDEELVFPRISEIYQKVLKKKSEDNSN